MTKEIDTLLFDCSAAGIVFHPDGDKLRPSKPLTPVSDSLLFRVKQSREDLIAFFSECFAWTHDAEICSFSPEEGVSDPFLGSLPLPLVGSFRPAGPA